MRHLLIFFLTAAMLTACTTDNDLDGTNLSEAAIVNGNTNESGYLFEGVWTIDNQPVEGTYLMGYTTKDGWPVAVFPSFPYEAVVSLLLPSVGKFQMAGQAETMVLPLTPVGYNNTAGYFQSGTDGRADLLYTTFHIVPEGASAAVAVSLELLPAETTAVVGATGASAILAIKRIGTETVNGEKRQWVLNPERRMTFVSVRRTR